MTPRRGEIYAVRLGLVEGSEQRGTRPAIVVSNDLFNEALPLVTVVPLTTGKRGRRVYPSEVVVPAKDSGLRADSIALAHQVRTVSRARLGRSIGRIDDETAQALDDALRLHLDLA